MNEMINTITQGDCLEVMKRIPDGYIDLTITSPPYDNLRTYNGFKWNFEKIAKELYRVTKEGGIVVWVVGDATIKGSETLTSFRQALFFQETGFNVHDTMIYEKASPSPPSHNRYLQSFEYMFILSKGRPKTSNLIRDRKNAHGGVRKAERSIRDVDGNLTSRGAKVIPEYSVRFNIWRYATGFRQSTSDKYAYEHPAIFPEKLAEDHIISWSNPGDIVFDPFVGSGTTAKMAVLNDRKYIGIDISEEYVDIARRRVGEALAFKNEKEID